MKKIFSMLLLVSIILSLTVGCANEVVQDSQKQDEEQPVKEITICNSWSFEEGFPTIATPETNSNYGIRFLANNFYETLVNYENGEIVPGLAERWNISDDGTIYTFYLKKGIKFSDGEDFNANAVKTNLDNIPIILGSYNGSYGMTTLLIKEVVIVDEYTVEVKLSDPYYGALQDFTIPFPMSMVSPKAYNKDGTYNDVIMTSTPGTGPYMYDGKSDGTVYTFIKNPYYNRKDSQVDVFHVKIIPNNESKLLALRNKEVDMIFGIDKLSYDTYMDFINNPQFKTMVSKDVIRTRFITFNSNAVPFDDVNVRLALNFAIDREVICKQLFYGLESPANTTLHSSLPYCDVDIEPFNYDVEKAKSLLNDSGWIDLNGDGIREKEGVKLEGEILFINTKAEAEDLLMYISSAAKEIGMDINITELDFMALIDKTMKQDYTMAYNDSYGAPYDPYLQINNFRTEPMVDALGMQALIHLENGNDIINSLITMTDVNKIQNQFDFIIKEIRNNASFLPISNMKELVVYNKDIISGYKFFGQPSNFDASSVTIENNLN